MTTTPTATPPAVHRPSAMNGFNIVLMGPTGTGKTYSIATLVNAGLEVFYLGLENGIESLIGYWVDKGLTVPKNLHWANAMSSSASFLDQQDMAKKANIMQLDGLSKLVDPNKDKYDQMHKLLGLLSNFVDERTGESFGPVDKWGPERVLVIDGLTGIGNAAMSNIVGGRPTKSVADWGTAQTFVMNLLRSLCDSCPCHFALLAHVERETDQVMGGVKIMPSTLGKSIAGLIAPMFSDVILAERQGEKFTWNTANPMADLKTRNLPIKADLQPDFGPIYKKWKARIEAFREAGV